LTLGTVGGGLLGLQLQSYLLRQNREKERAFIEAEVERKYLELRKQQKEQESGGLGSEPAKQDGGGSVASQ